MSRKHLADRDFGRTTRAGTALSTCGTANLVIGRKVDINHGQGEASFWNLHASERAAKAIATLRIHHFNHTRSVGVALRATAATDGATRTSL